MHQVIFVCMHAYCVNVRFEVHTASSMKMRVFWDLSQKTLIFVLCSCLIFEFLTALEMTMSFFWVVTPYRLVDRYQRFGEPSLCSCYSYLVFFYITFVINIIAYRTVKQTPYILGASSKWEMWQTTYWHWKRLLLENIARSRYEQTKTNAVADFYIIRVFKMQ
jgi:hypothetical protein